MMKMMKMTSLMMIVSVGVLVGVLLWFITFIYNMKWGRGRGQEGLTPANTPYISPNAVAPYSVQTPVVVNKDDYLTYGGLQPIKLLSLTGYDTRYNPFYYDSNNYDVQYHDSIDLVLEKDNDMTGEKGTLVKGPDGKMVYVNWTEMPTYPIYYKTGSYPYSPSSYVPSYEDSVYLSYYTNKTGVTYTK
jgi:hypothetical protein